jgi:hypothetical protein
MTEELLFWLLYIRDPVFRFELNLERAFIYHAQKLEVGTEKSYQEREIIEAINQ